MPTNPVPLLLCAGVVASLVTPMGAQGQKWMIKQARYEMTDDMEYWAILNAAGSTGGEGGPAKMLVQCVAGENGQRNFGATLYLPRVVRFTQTGRDMHAELRVRPDRQPVTQLDAMVGFKAPGMVVALSGSDNTWLTHQIATAKRLLVEVQSVYDGPVVYRFALPTNSAETVQRMRRLCTS